MSPIDEEFVLLEIEKEFFKDEEFMDEVIEAVILKYQRKGQKIQPFAAIGEIAAHIRNHTKVKDKFKAYKDEQYEKVTYNFAILLLREIELKHGEQRKKVEPS